MSTTQTPTGTPLPSAERAGWWQRQTTTARVLVVAVPLLVVALLVVVFFPRSPEPAETLPATTGTSQRANACLGGSSDLNSAVQYAQANAPLTGTGAAEFAATLVRWSNAAPSPTPAEKDRLMPQLVTREALPSFPTTPPTQTIDGIRGDATAVDGYYRVDSATPTSASVSLVMPLTVTKPGQAPESRTIWGTYTFSAVDGMWRLAGIPVAADRVAIEQRGQLFQGSC